MSILVSVITPTCRPDGLEIVAKALRRQLFTNYEWLVGSKFESKYGTWVKDDHKGGVWSLGRCYNDLIREAKGDLLVSWQDYTFAKENALSKFVEGYKKEPKTIVSGVGNKYASDAWVVKTWQDPRERDDQGSFYSTDFSNIEWNFCAIPKEALYAVGGFDEEMDYKFFGLDGYNVCERINYLGGYDFKLDQTNKSYSLLHNRPEGWDEHNALNGSYLSHRKSRIMSGNWPKLNYL